MPRSNTVKVILGVVFTVYGKKSFLSTESDTKILQYDFLVRAQRERLADAWRELNKKN